jgi:translation elongation factor EF-Ts
MVPEEDMDITEILEQAYIKDPSLTIAGLIKSKIATIGENIQLKSYRRVTL